ncbi:hypothetical protein [Agrobacterium tumefaciens]|uniref:hypothetical protein n=1 Tax=Agrobacterium tumefaciens TaxID=358 RepID=UPI00287EC69F|nr:hypothetical protein [Agrobacterium tumefaciens]MDS7596167.1 hypothetical protein [Agrobacterium tumefaciens]
MKQTQENIEENAPEQVQKVFFTPDRILAWTGIGLAAAAAFFPWYVFFNEDKFAIKVAEGDRTRDLPHTGPREVFSVSPLAMTNRNKTDIPPAELPDMLTTATVNDDGKEKQNDLAAARADQPFPGKTSFRLLHVSNGRALIEDGSGMYMVRIGSTMPDNTQLTKIEQRDGEWLIETSSGRTYYPGE